MNVLLWQATTSQHCSTKKPCGTNLAIILLVMRILGYLATSSHPSLTENCPWNVDSPILPGCPWLQVSELPRCQRKPIGREEKKELGPWEGKLSSYWKRSFPLLLLGGRGMDQRINSVSYRVPITLPGYIHAPCYFQLCY